MLTVHVVSHTHWDREWYHPAERFRQRLVALVDELLDDPPPIGQSFLLDGQTAVLEDYLQVRPDRASELAAALRAGRLEAGPWFVLADELIPSGEALVRNLLAGRRSLRALRADPPEVLYCPDSFGHPAALPTLARGFDCSLVILWRGYGGARAPAGDTIWWTAPNSDRVLVYHLSPSGYELGANLPADRDAARARWSAMRAQLGPRSSVDSVLLLNGADHHARQHQLGDALSALGESASPDEVLPSTLNVFARDIEKRAAGRSLPEIRGELRDSYGYTWTLQGTLASRAPQKRNYVWRERELLRDVEPWTAFVAFYQGKSLRHLSNAAWRTLLLCQPHDTLCGCSIDEVSRAMDARLESVAAQAAGLREDALLDLAGHDRDAARAARDGWKPTLLVRNRAARVRSGVAIVELTTWVADVPVGLGSSHVDVKGRELPPAPTPTGTRVQALERSLTQERAESPRAYPDHDVVARTMAAVWIPDVPPYGIAALELSDSPDSPDSPARSRAGAQRVRVSKGSMDNGSVKVTVNKDGSIAIEQDGRTVHDLLDWECRTDLGDLYTPSIREPKLQRRLVRTRVVHRGPLRGAIEQHWRLTGQWDRIDVHVRLVLDAGAVFLRVQIYVENFARDHRLRVRFRSDVDDGLTVADAAFGPTERRPIVVGESDARMEHPIRTAPLHRYVSLFDPRRGATVFSDGLTEYETDAGSIAVTLVRSVDELSRSDLPERPGNAGWPASTPAALCFGPFEAELSFMLHGPRTNAVTDEIERTADDALYPLTGQTLRSALRVPTAMFGVSLEGAGLAFSCAKESEMGEWLVLRCVNLLDQESAGSWRVGRELREAHIARLDETPLTPLEVHGDHVRFLAAPRSVVTLLVR